MPESDHEHIIDTGKGTFTLDELGPLMPGMAEIMPLVGDRVWKTYYAGQARNKPLAVFQLKQAVSLMRKGAKLRPKFADDTDLFIKGEVQAVMQAIQSDDWEGFDAAFKAMVDAANELHGKYGKAYLYWKVPDMPPPDLDMTPRG
jgi:hypothetical protein